MDPMGFEFRMKDKYVGVKYNPPKFTPQKTNMTMEDHHLLKRDPLHETNSSALKIDGGMKVLLGWPIFRGELLVSGSLHLQMVVVLTKSMQGSYPPKKSAKSDRRMAPFRT